MKKIIAIDVDDVLFDLVPLWVRKYNFIWDDNLDYKKVVEWDISKFVKVNCGKKIYSYLDSNMYLDSNLVEDSDWGISQLRKMGYRVIVVTSNSFNMGGVKFDWLNRNGFDIGKEDYVESGDKSLIKFNLLLDDNYDTIKSCGKRGVLFNRPWNLNYKHSQRVSSWRQFIKGIKENKYGL